MGIPQIADLVLETANAPGTGAIILGGAMDGRQTFADAFPTGGEVYYYASDGTQTEWGVGTLTLGSPNTLARTTVLGNLFGSKNALNFTSSITVWSEIPAQRTQSLDDTGMLPVTANPDFARDVALSAKVAENRYGAIGKVLQLNTSSTQVVFGPVTFSGTITVPTPDDFTKNRAIGALDADGRYAKLSADNALLGNLSVGKSITIGAQSNVYSNNLFYKTTSGPFSAEQVAYTNSSNFTKYINFYDASSNILGQFWLSIGDGRVHSSKGTGAFVSELTTAGVISGGTFTKTPLNDGTGRSVLRQVFRVQVTPDGNGNAVASFPIAYSSVPNAEITGAYEMANNTPVTGSIRKNGAGTDLGTSTTSVPIGMWFNGGASSQPSIVTITAEGLVT